MRSRTFQEDLVTAGGLAADRRLGTVLVVADQRGFTVFELMIATAIGLLLISSVIGIMYQSAGMALSMQSQLTLNREAREVFRIMHRGGAVLDGGTAELVPALRSFNSGISDTSSLTNFQVTVDRDDGTDETTNRGRFRLRATVSGDEREIFGQALPSTSVACRAANDPIDECTGTGTVQTYGYLTETPIKSGEVDITAGAGGSQYEVSATQLRLIDPVAISANASGAYNENRVYHFLFHHPQEK